jgi:hypothetical protein
MVNSNDCLSQLLDQIKIASPILYFISALIFALIIRALLCFFKAWALTNGELDNPEKRIRALELLKSTKVQIILSNNNKRLDCQQKLAYDQQESP